MIGYVPRKYTPVTDVTPYRELIVKYCKKMGISVSELKQRHASNRLKRLNGNVRLDEMRRCLSLYLFENTYLTTSQIGFLLGDCDHTSVLYHVKKAKGHREYDDEIFMNYYNILLEVVEKPVENLNTLVFKD